MVRTSDVLGALCLHLPCVCCHLSLPLISLEASVAQPQFRRPGSLLHCCAHSVICILRTFSYPSCPKPLGCGWDTSKAHLEGVRGAQDPGVCQRRTRTWFSSGRKGERDSTTTGLSLNQPVLVIPASKPFSGEEIETVANIHQIVANLVVLRALSVLLIHLICFNPVCLALP